jgi:7-cyano-7-deazaguanine synthase
VGSVKNRQKKAVVLLSGGLDSSTCLAIAKNQRFSCYSIAFDYGQKHRIELDMAARQAKAGCVVEHKVIKVDLAIIGGSALTDQIEVPKADHQEEIPVTYVPARNTIFLSLGLAWAEVLGARDLFIGANQVDYSGYPDCREEFLLAYEKMANLATKAGVEGEPFKIHAPLLNLDKGAIIKKGFSLGVDYKNTHSCYDPDSENRACGKCPSCILRLKGFKAAGMKDPIEYQKV